MEINWLFLIIMGGLAFFPIVAAFDPRVRGDR
jgi:hypothetical protein